jgi:hypothetical protein
LTYDVRSRQGALLLAHGECCDMSACIALFEAIDPAVRYIETRWAERGTSWTNSRLDTSYRRHNGTWTAEQRRG